VSNSQRRVLQSDLLKYLHTRFGVACEKCGTSLNLAVDHKVPLSVGGKNNYTNIRILCRDCQKDYHGTKGKKRDSR
jgi:5-methylcytosine-specific restriction endonuclease McrA